MKEEKNLYRVSQKNLKDFDERLHHDVITEKLSTFFIV